MPRKPNDKSFVLSNKKDVMLPVMSKYSNPLIRNRFGPFTGLHTILLLRHFPAQ